MSIWLYLLFCRQHVSKFRLAPERATQHLYVLFSFSLLSYTQIYYIFYVLIIYIYKIISSIKKLKDFSFAVSELYVEW